MMLVAMKEREDGRWIVYGASPLEESAPICFGLSIHSSETKAKVELKKLLRKYELYNPDVYDLEGIH